MSDKTYASCRNNEFNRFYECKKCKWQSEKHEKDLRNRQNLLSW